MAKIRLSHIADLTLIVASVVVAAMAGHVYLSQPPRAASQLPEPLKVSERVDIPGIDFSRTQQTLLLVLSPRCPYCTESMPFYSRLQTASKARAEGKLRIVVVGREDSDSLRAYLKGYDIAVDDVVSVTADSAPSPNTPTLILVDADGVVQKVWVGRQSPNGEEDVIKAIS